MLWIRHLVCYGGAPCASANRILQQCCSRTSDRMHYVLTLFHAFSHSQLNSDLVRIEFSLPVAQTRLLRPVAVVVLLFLCWFLHSLCNYSVFWDLYCAAPEKRDTNEHSSEAKAFHDYVSNRKVPLDVIVNLCASCLLSSSRRMEFHRCPDRRLRITFL